MLKLILGVDPGAECLSFEGVVKELAAFVSGADNAESVANHFCAVALECGCVLTAFAALSALVFFRAGVSDLVDAVTSSCGYGKCRAALAFKIFLEDLLRALLRNEGEKIYNEEKRKNRECKDFNSRIEYRVRDKAERSKVGKSVSYRNYVHVEAEKLV